MVKWGGGSASIVLIPRRGGHSHLAICADCGFAVMTPTAEGLEKFAGHACPNCIAPVLDGCQMSHTWGTCAACPRFVDDRPEAG